MNLIEGHLPTKDAWRAMVLIRPTEPFGRGWQLGYSLAKVNRGQFIATVLIEDIKPSTVEAARKKLRQAQLNCPDDVEIYPVIVLAANDMEATLMEMVETTELDLLLVYLDGPVWHNVNKLPCAVAVVRGDHPLNGDTPSTAHPLQRILVPTAGGPNTVHALSFLVPLAPDVEITAVYIAPNDLPQEQALGRQQLRQLLTFVDGNEKVESKVITAVNVSQGIVEEAANGYDLVIIGASGESSIDKIIFGDVPGAVVRESKVPIAVVRQPRHRMGDFGAVVMWWLQHLLPRMGVKERADAFVRIRRSARPDIDFFMMIGLSAMIAALGLIISSPAVVIGAMLVAPLMSPIVGTGLAAVLGDIRFLRRSLDTVLRGVLLAIGVSMLAGLLSLNEPLTPELAARIEPSLIDLGIALFSGLAGAYAICRSDAAGALPGVAIAAALVPPLSTIGITLVDGDWQAALGATLLFVTNFVAISAATAVMFLILGFRPSVAQKERKNLQVRSVRLAIGLVGLVAALLISFTFFLALDKTTEEIIEESVTERLSLIGEDVRLNNPPLFEFVVVPGEDRNETVLQLDLVVRSNESISPADAATFEQEINDVLVVHGWYDRLDLSLGVIEVVNSR